MYQGFVGPIPLLHWVVPSDGEASYLLTEIEMFITLLVLSTFGTVLYNLLRNKNGNQRSAN